ncbi:para-nitrobenzyl esterase chain A [Staphylococcus saccharolyticus]|uniref:Para-nitrobenzyl esterase chain A n=1 Tax=Staphylococcus saccharolyticus TaxID=33028 RepID=A0A380GYI3_9STAP|nr:para-nitrobenzyl esterase chain A [Staphylococcus saccharolyticus]
MVKVEVHGQQVVKGIRQIGIDTFLVIPYAQPLNKISRFQHSQLFHTAHSDIDATCTQPIPPQPYNALENFFSFQHHHFNDFKQLDNCLYLNIWRQANHHHKKPVIIYFYGGGFTQGHGTAQLSTISSETGRYHCRHFQLSLRYFRIFRLVIF